MLRHTKIFSNVSHKHLQKRKGVRRCWQQLAVSCRLQLISYTLAAGSDFPFHYSADWCGTWDFYNWHGWRKSVQCGAAALRTQCGVCVCVCMCVCVCVCVCLADSCCLLRIQQWSKNTSDNVHSIEDSKKIVWPNQRKKKVKKYYFFVCFYELSFLVFFCFFVVFFCTFVFFCIFFVFFCFFLVYFCVFTFCIFLVFFYTLLFPLLNARSAGLFQKHLRCTHYTVAFFFPFSESFPIIKKMAAFSLHWSKNASPEINR